MLRHSPLSTDALRRSVEKARIVMKRVTFMTITCIAALALLSSCDRDLFRLNVTPETVKISRPDDHPVLRAHIIDFEGQEVRIDDVTFESKDPGIVEVSDWGRLSARASGDATIVARTQYDEVEVKVQVRLVSVATP
jgi:hypothetical protein